MSAPAKILAPDWAWTIVIDQSPAPSLELAEKVGSLGIEQADVAGRRLELALTGTATRRPP